MRRRWSEKQKRVLDLYKDPSRFILVIGSPGAGKTASAIAGYVKWSLHYEYGNFALIAKTLRQCEAIALQEVARFCREHGIPFGKIADKIYKVGNNEFHLFSANNRRQAEAIQGYNLVGFYVDEVVNVPEIVMLEVNNRLRDDEDSKAVLTANTNSANHWFYREYVKRAEDIGMHTLLLDLADNPALPESYKQSIIDTSRGGWYQRRVLNQWAPLSGNIYLVPDSVPFDRPKEEATDWYLSVDPADSSSTHAILFGRYNGVYYTYDEWVWNHEERGQISHREQVNRIKHWLEAMKISLKGIVFDPASPNFGLLLYETFDVLTMKAKKDVKEGIRIVQYCLDKDYIHITDRTPILHEQMVIYQWDPVQAAKGIDAPMKYKDHGPDAFRYFAYTVFMGNT